MGRLVAGVALGALLVAASGAGATRPFPGSASWADARHGWAPNPSYEELSKRTWKATGDSSLCSTEDGGRSWRVIFVGGNYVFTAVRTSGQAGIVSSGAHGHFEFWTRDNGKHWLPTDLTEGTGGLGDPAPVLVGRGAQLYYARGFGDTVYQLTPWPPSGPAECSGPWSRSMLAEDADPAGNVCLGPPVNAGTRSEPVVTIDGNLVRLARVPDEFVAVFERGSDAQVTVVVRRAGTNVARELPAPDLPAGAHGVLRRLDVTWPTISLAAFYAADPENRETYEVVWRSTDGGAMWTVDRAPSWRQERMSPIARSGAAAGALGDEIVLAGGYVRATRRNETEHRASRLVQAYRPGDRSWRRLPDLPVALTRASAASTVTELYVVGGFGAGGKPRRDAFLLRDGRWRKLPAASEPRAAAGAAIVAGKLYVVGGVGPKGLARRALAFDLRGRRWSLVPGPRPRAYLGVAASRERIVALGGRTSGPETNMSLVEGWRPGERRWSSLTPLPSRRSDIAAVAVGNRVAVLGGAATGYYLPLGLASVLDLRSGRWERLPDLTWPRHGLSAAVVADRVFALVGGDDDGQEDLSTAAESLLLGG